MLGQLMTGPLDPLSRAPRRCRQLPAQGLAGASGRDEPARTMRVVEISAPGGPEVLRTGGTSGADAGARADPDPGRLAGVNRPDALQRAGNYAPPPGASDLPGLECAGEVAAVGPGVTRLAVGDRSARCCPAAAMPNTR